MDSLVFLDAVFPYRHRHHQQLPYSPAQSSLQLDKKIEARQEM